MRKYFYILTGGFFGAILRYYIKQVNFIYVGGFPVNTFIINILGSFLIGFFSLFFIKFTKYGKEMRLGIVTGFLGAFTTFSAFSKETAGLIESGRVVIAVLYLFFSVAVGLGLVALGSLISGKLFIRGA